MSQEPTPPLPSPALAPLVLELLQWVAARPRTYADTMEAWRTSCPRMPVWEEATLGGLVEVVPEGSGLRAHPVRLTPRGEAFLATHAE